MEPTSRTKTLTENSSTDSAANKRSLVGKSIEIIYIVFSAIFIVCVVLSFHNEPNDTEYDPQIISDELTRAKHFIGDWYDELTAKYKSCDVFYNELRFNNGAYTLTVAGDRIRAVYPRGERFFKLEHIRYLEFYKENGKLLCRLYFYDTGEFVFKIG